MCGGSTQIEIGDRRSVLCPTWGGSQEEQLLQCQLTLKNIPFRQTPLTLEVERGDDLPMQDDLADVRRVLRERVDDDITERFALLIPGAVDQMKRRVLDEAGHHMLACRCHAGIGQ